MNLYKYTYPLFKKLAFSIDAEIAHNISIKAMSMLGPILKNETNQFDFKVEYMGRILKSPFGIAAGLDKNAEAIDYLTFLPIGLLEIGTVTKLTQLGNERPRLFRLVKEKSLLNRMGFNNLGSDEVLNNLKKSNRHQKLIGINLGKNKLTENKNAKFEYAYLYAKFNKEADYLVINISSPNTPGLRELLSGESLEELFSEINKVRFDIQKPIYVKVSPDMTHSELKCVVEKVDKFKLTGIIATNTTIIQEIGEGGVSGELLYLKAKQVREYLLSELKNYPQIELIGVGGFSNFLEIKDFWIKGGGIVQFYTSFIFNGPNFFYDLEKSLKEEYEKYKVNNFNDYLKAIRPKN
jgi:dihydroorotate dehydrogenase